MRLALLALSLLILCGIACAAPQPNHPLPTYTCHRTSSPIIIDGRRDEPAWEQAAVFTDFHLADGLRTPTDRTEFRALWDAQNLYLSFVCHEEQMGKLKTLSTRRDESVWEDDCVEIFLDAKRSRKDYDHLVISAAGTRFDEHVAGG
jgi:hypothetical protein